MMWFRKKKAVEENKEVEIKSEHTHTWKDMPWYMKVYYNGTNKTAGYEIIEPYICVTCGKRKNVTLEKEDYSNISAEEREDIFKKVRIRYEKYLKPRAVVEDMIYNILLVKDPGYLQMVEKMNGIPHSGCGTSSQQEKLEDYRIHVRD